MEFILHQTTQHTVSMPKMMERQLLTGELNMTGALK
jgi:hypothetical protein